MIWPFDQYIIKLSLVKQEHNYLTASNTAYLTLFTANFLSLSLKKTKVAVFSSNCPYQISPSKLQFSAISSLSLSLSLSLSFTINHQLLAFSSLRLLYCIATIIQVHSPNAFKPSSFLLSFWSSLISCFMFGGRENVGNVSPENKIYEIFLSFVPCLYLIKE